MPNSYDEDGRGGTHMNAECLLDEHGLIGSGPLHMVKVQITKHFISKHPDENLCIQGVHFSIWEAPLRCDVCNLVAEPPFWTRVITPLQIEGDMDGLWLVCDTCESLIQANAVDDLVKRHWAQTVEMAPHLSGNTNMEGGAREHITALVPVLAAGTVTRDTV